MAADSDTTVVSQVVGTAENVQDALELISPTETPVLTNMMQGEATAVYKEWQEDTIGQATHNPKPEGDNPTATSTQPTMYGNYVQRNEQTAKVSDTANRVRKYGRGSEIDREVANKLKLIKNELEVSICGQQPAVGSDPREMAGLGPMCYQNYYGGADGSIPDNSSGGAFDTGLTQPTAQYQLEESQLLDVWEQCWTQGGNIDMIVTNGTIKRKLSNASGVATQYRDNPSGRAGTIIGAMDIYVSDFSEMGAAMVADRFMPQSTIYLLDSDLCYFDWLQPTMRKPLARTGAAVVEMVDCEATLRVGAPKGIGCLFGIDESQDLVPIQP